jgi:hypothetical protein
MYLLLIALCVSATLATGRIVWAAENNSLSIAPKQLAHEEFLKVEKELENIEKLDDEIWPPRWKRSNENSGPVVRKSGIEIHELLHERRLKEQQAKVHLLSVWSSDLPDEDRRKLEQRIFRLEDDHPMVFEAIAPDEFRTKNKPFKPGGSSEVDQFLGGKSDTIQGIDSTKPFVKYRIEPDD